jgi:hypothetical protein
MELQRMSPLRSTNTRVERRVTFSENIVKIYFYDDEDSRNARRGTWILQRRIFVHCVRQLDNLLSPVLRRHLFKYHVEVMECKL